MNNRVKRVSELIKRELSRILLRNAGFSNDVLVTVTRVELSVDLRQARVYVSAIPEEKNNVIIQSLDHNIFEIQRELNKRLMMKVLPRIVFVEEKMTVEASRVEELLNKLKKSDDRGAVAKWL